MQCKFCFNSMYQDDRCAIGNGNTIECYHCAYCESDYDRYVDRKNNVYKESWSNHNKNNYKTLKEAIIEILKKLNEGNNNFTNLIELIDKKLQQQKN